MGSKRSSRSAGTRRRSSRSSRGRPRYGYAGAGLTKEDRLLAFIRATPSCTTAQLKAAGFKRPMLMRLFSAGKIDIDHNTKGEYVVRVLEPR